MRPRHHHRELDHGTIGAAGELDIVSGDTVGAGAFARTGGNGTDRDGLDEVSAGAERQCDTLPSFAVATQGPGFEQSTVV